MYLLDILEQGLTAGQIDPKQAVFVVEDNARIPCSALLKGYGGTVRRTESSERIQIFPRNEDANASTTESDLRWNHGGIAGVSDSVPRPVQRNTDSTLYSRELTTAARKASACFAPLAVESRQHLEQPALFPVGEIIERNESIQSKWFREASSNKIMMTASPTRLTR